MHASSRRAASSASAGFSGLARRPAPLLLIGGAARSPPPTSFVVCASRSRCSPPPCRASSIEQQQSGAASGAASGSATPTSPSLAQLKANLRTAVDGLDRGIFGAPAARRAEADAAARALEAHNPTPAPLRDAMHLVAGDWRLLYTTITIAGVRKTKLGLREFVKLGAFAQRIDPDAREAVNEISFSVSGLGAALDGALTVRATYEVVSEERVAISLAGSTLAPSRLEALFRANYDLLLSIFNPEGWLDVTYVDEEMRIGRDDKGHLFVLERAAGGGGGGGATTTPV